MLSLDTLIACVQAFLTTHECKNWRVGARTESRASTRVCVESVYVTWDDAPLELRHIGLREAWVLLGGMEHGAHDMHAQVTLVSSSWQPGKLATVRTAEELTAFLEANLPTGEALQKAQARLADEKAAQERTEKAVLAAVTEAEAASFVRRARERLAAALVGTKTPIISDATSRLLRDRLVRLVRDA